MMKVDRETRRKQRANEAYEILLWEQIQKAVTARWCRSRAYDQYKVEDGISAGYEAALVAYRQNGDANTTSWYVQLACNRACDHWLEQGLPVKMSASTAKRMLRSGYDLPVSCEYAEE